MTAVDYRIPAGDPILETKAYRFAADVVDGKIVSGKRRIQACHRFLRELERAAVDSAYPWRFDADKGYRPIRFIEKFMVPTKGDYASLLIAEGTPLVVVSSNLGHAQTSTTSDIYSHVIASAEAQAAQVLDKFSDDIHPKRGKGRGVIKQEKALYLLRYKAFRWSCYPDLNWTSNTVNDISQSCRQSGK